MNTPQNLKYTKSDEWFDPATGKAGLTDYAQSQLSDIVFIEILTDVDDPVETGQAIVSVESVKAAGEVYAPVTGTVAAVNNELTSSPETLNSDPYEKGWLIQIQGGDPSGLMDAAAYEQYCAGRNH